MIDHKHALTMAILIAMTCFASVIGALFVYLNRPELISPSWMLTHLVLPGGGIAGWLFMRWATRKFPNPHNLEASLQKYYGVWLVFACAVCAFMQIIILGVELEILEHSPGRAKLFIAAVGLGMVVLGNASGKLPSPYKGRPEPFSWDKMARFEGRTSVIIGLSTLLYAFAYPSRMATALLILWATFTVVVTLLKRHQLKQDKKTLG